MRRSRVGAEFQFISSRFVDVAFYADAHGCAAKAVADAKDNKAANHSSDADVHSARVAERSGGTSVALRSCSGRFQ